MPPDGSGQQLNPELQCGRLPGQTISAASDPTMYCIATNSCPGSTLCCIDRPQQWALGKHPLRECGFRHFAIDPGAATDLANETALAEPFALRRE